jgi:hypothetical protein
VTSGASYRAQPHELRLLVTRDVTTATRRASHGSDLPHARWAGDL